MEKMKFEKVVAGPVLTFTKQFRKMLDSHKDDLFGGFLDDLLFVMEKYGVYRPDVAVMFSGRNDRQRKQAG